MYICTDMCVFDLSTETGFFARFSFHSTFLLALSIDPHEKAAAQARGFVWVWV